MKLKEYLIKAGINFEEKDGAITVGGWLDLSNTGITSLPDNLTVGGWLEIAIKALKKMVNYNSVAEQVDKYYYIVLDVREIGKKALKEIKE